MAPLQGELKDGTDEESTHDPVDAARMAEAVGGGRGRLFPFRLAAGAGGRPGDRPAAQTVVHPPLDGRRPQPDGHLRPQARLRQRRPLPGNSDGGRRRPLQRTPSEDCKVHRPHGRRPLHDHQGRRTRAGGPADAHRHARPGPDPVPRSWLPHRAGTDRPRRCAAGLRERCPQPRDQPARAQPRLPRAELRAAGRRRRRPDPVAAGPGRRRAFAEGAEPRTAARRAGRPPRCPRQPASGHGKCVRREPPRRGRGQPPVGLRQGRPAHAQRRRPGVQPGGREGRGARRLRPQPVRPGLPAGAPAGGARRAVHRGGGWAASTAVRWVGTHTPTISIR